MLFRFWVFPDCTFLDISTLYHFHVTQIKRSAGQSAIASAAYRSGEKLHSEHYSEDSDYAKRAA